MTWTSKVQAYRGAVALRPTVALGSSARLGDRRRYTCRWERLDYVPHGGREFRRFGRDSLCTIDQAIKGWRVCRDRDVRARLYEAWGGLAGQVDASGFRRRICGRGVPRFECSVAMREVLMRIVERRERNEAPRRWLNHLGDDRPRSISPVHTPFLSYAIGLGELRMEAFVLLVPWLRRVFEHPGPLELGQLLDGATRLFPETEQADADNLNMLVAECVQRSWLRDAGGAFVLGENVPELRHFLSLPLTCERRGPRRAP